MVRLAMSRHAAPRRISTSYRHVIRCLFVLVITIAGIEIFTSAGNCSSTEACTIATEKMTFNEAEPVLQLQEGLTKENETIWLNEDVFYPVDSGKQGAFWPVVDDKHWKDMVRVFPPWDYNTSWCESKNQQTQSPTGLLFVKVHKAASSTLAGVNMRIAAKHGCASRQHHEDSRLYGNRDKAHSFLYTSIRDPASRALSWIYYSMSNQGHNVTERPDTVLNLLRQRFYFQHGGADNARRIKLESGAQVGYLNTGPALDKPLWHTEEPDQVQNFTLARQRVQEVMGQYDLILLVERLHESLVALQLLLQLETADILYLSSKITGGYSFTWGPNRGCHKLQYPPVMDPTVQAFLSSTEFYAANYQDFLLYKAANASLDETIDSLGRERFQKALIAFQSMMEKAKQCQTEAIFPCSSTGIYRPPNETNCYLRDWGCGYPCLDRLFGP